MAAAVFIPFGPSLSSPLQVVKFALMFTGKSLCEICSNEQLLTTMILLQNSL
ncbi:polymerase gamma 2 [Perilla frutescens var. hirtella]|nr:polymerase gamma 2 [Perilla frutescens var. hirtella]